MYQHNQPGWINNTLNTRSLINTKRHYISITHPFSFKVRQRRAVNGEQPLGSLLDPYIAVTPEADGDSTPLGQRPLSVLPVVYRLWASHRLGHPREWVEGRLPKSVFSLGNGLSSVEAWFSTALDIEEVVSGAGSDQLHVVVADVIKSFDTVDRSILDCTLGRLGLPDWFRRHTFLTVVSSVPGLSSLAMV